MPRRYAIYDVFTDRPLSGNPLAVVFDAEGLDTAQMQAIAREFNLSETSFVLPPQNPSHRAQVRIFTPDYEMVFAGHPTVGTAIALASLNGGPEIMVLEEKIGPVRCAVSNSAPAAFAEFDLPGLPRRLAFEADTEAVASAIGLPPDELGFDGHVVSAWSAGVPYIAVPVNGLEAAGRVRFDSKAWSALAPATNIEKHASAYVYTRETTQPGHDFHARMFVSGYSSYEDPATGSAAAAFAGAVVAFDRPGDGVHRIRIEQGIEMGRASLLHVSIDISDGSIEGARIGGNAVAVAEGMLLA